MKLVIYVTSTGSVFFHVSPKGAYFRALNGGC